MREAVKHLTTNWVGRPFHFFPEVDSTNNVLAQMASTAPTPAGATVVADYQSAGRGRRSRRWQAPPGTSLLFSVLFRPQWPAAQSQWLTMIAALAALHALEAAVTVPLALKWPNDIMLCDAAAKGAPEGSGPSGDGAAWCKMGGILLESQLVGDRLQQAIVGIGLNINIPRDQLPAAATPASSLLAATGQPLAREPLLANVLQQLESGYEQAARQSPHPAWNARLLTRNRPVRVTGAGETVEGTALGSDEWGRLILRDAHGALHHFAAGDVTLR